MLSGNMVRVALLASAVSVFSFAIFANGEGTYSKTDVARMFKMPMNAWNQNVMFVQNQGTAQALGNPENGLGMAIQTSNRYLIVRPNYRTLDRPEFLSVTVGFPPHQVPHLTKEVLREVIDRLSTQLEPEFAMTATVKKVDGGIANTLNT